MKPRARPGPARTHLRLAFVAALLGGCFQANDGGSPRLSSSVPSLERIVVAKDARGFIAGKSGRAFHPWGVNYGNAGRLMEDFWDTDWETLAGDFQELRAMGFNVVRVHLQFGKFMESPDRPKAAALKQFARLLRLAEQSRLYLDVTGLACYRPADTPAWYDALDEPARWAAQAKFWEAIAKAGVRSPAVFCYDLMNEVISPAQRRGPRQWRSGSLLGDYDFLQYIALEPAGRPREEIARQWIRRMSAAIRKHDRRALITVGLLPWSRQWKHLSGFVPEKIAPHLDFISVHIYPDRKLPEEAMEALRVCAVGKPVVVEETFPLSCDGQQFESFMRASREVACGWIVHYDGATPDDLDALEKAGKLTMTQAIYREALRSFIQLRPEIATDNGKDAVPGR